MAEAAFPVAISLTEHFTWLIDELNNHYTGSAVTAAVWLTERSRCVSGEKQQELPRSYQGSKQSQEVTPIWKTEERKTACQWSTRCLCPARPLLWSGARQVEGLFTSIFWSVPVKDKFSQTLLGIWTIIFRLDIFLGFWKELTSTWSSVHNGLRLVWLVWPPAHLLPHMFQISSCKRPDYFWLVKTSELYSIIYIFLFY